MDLVIPSIVVIVLAQVADLITTTLVLGKGGRELNPIVRSLIAEFGTVPALAIKGVVLSGLVLWSYLSGGSQDAPWAFHALAAFYVLVIANNVKVLRSL